jgi:hypothetical protein
MINPFHDVNWNPGPAEKRKFAVSLIIGFPALALFFSLVNWLIHHSFKPGLLWLGASGLAVGVVLWLVPQIARPFYVVWYFAACCIGIVMANLVFSLFFFLIFSPLGWLRRAMNPAAFPKSPEKARATYWQPAEKVTDIKRYYRQS